LSAEEWSSPSSSDASPQSLLFARLADEQRPPQRESCPLRWSYAAPGRSCHEADLLTSNRVPRFYLGGRAIDELRGMALEAGDKVAPEDWVGSTTTVLGSASYSPSDPRWRRFSSTVSPPRIPICADGAVHRKVEQGNLRHLATVFGRVRVRRCA